MFDDGVRDRIAKCQCWPKLKARKDQVSLSVFAWVTWVKALPATLSLRFCSTNQVKAASPS